MRHPSSAVQCRGMDVRVQWLETSGCLPSSMPTTHPPDKGVWSCLRPRRQQLDRIIFHWRHQMASSVSMLVVPRYALCRAGEDYLDVQGRLRCTRLMNGSTAFIRQEWDLAVGRGHSQWTRSTLYTGLCFPNVLMMMTIMMMMVIMMMMISANNRCIQLRPMSDRRDNVQCASRRREDTGRQRQAVPWWCSTTSQRLGLDDLL